MVLYILFQLVDVICGDFVPSETSTLPVTTVDTHNVVDTQRTLFGVDKQFGFTSTAVIPLSEDHFEHIVGIDFTLGFNQKPNGKLTWIDNVNNVLGGDHYEIQVIRLL